MRHFKTWGLALLTAVYLLVLESVLVFVATMTDYGVEGLSSGWASPVEGISMTEIILKDCLTLLVGKLWFGLTVANGLLLGALSQLGAAARTRIPLWAICPANAAVFMIGTSLVAPNLGRQFLEIGLPLYTFAFMPLSALAALASPFILSKMRWLPNSISCLTKPYLYSRNLTGAN